MMPSMTYLFTDLSIKIIDVQRVLYLDIDILVTRNIGFFLQDLTHLLFFHQQKLYQAAKSNLVITSKSEQIDNNKLALKLDFAAFLDAKGHYVGFCSGCEKWHTGMKSSPICTLSKISSNNFMLLTCNFVYANYVP